MKVFSVKVLACGAVAVASMLPPALANTVLNARDPSLDLTTLRTYLNKINQSQAIQIEKSGRDVNYHYQGVINDPNFASLHKAAQTYMGSQGISPNDLQNPATLQTVVNNVQTTSPTANSEVVYAAVLPSSFSLISSNRVGAVKNQGGCASCVGFSTSSTLESTLKTQGVNMVVSAADIFFCVGYADASCANGWSIDTAARKVSQYGFVSDSCFAYKPVQQACTFGCPQGRHLGLVSHHIPSTVEAKRHILTNGAVLTALTVYEDFMNCCSNNQVYHQGANQPLVGGHAVACVGWDDTLQAWLCQNSWDTWWGTKGFFWIGYGQSGIMGDMYGFV